ncbi:hypothetical protein [Candidatus Lokiarchaeum ossiferum]|uniref:hypothetical protein n=1 Tax=Candidatus Lokiarchaeum ossiferum TaxID=2951803 RepID=UPI00352E8F40
MALSMAEIGEITFNIIYLTFIWMFVVKMFLKRKNVQKEDWKIASLMMLGFFLLAFGDTGHVGFRVVAYALGGLENNATLVGLGALSTAITVGILYMIILEVWRIQFNKPRDILYYILMGVGVVRLILFVFPQNEWGNVVPPLEFGLARNIPLMIQGLGVAILILRDARAEGNTTFTNLAYCIFVSYLFYTPVILFVRSVPALGMLMIPKTMAYMAMAWIVYKAYFSISSEKSITATPFIEK